MELTLNAPGIKDPPAPPDIETRIRDFIAENLLYSEQGYPLANHESFLQKGVIDSLGVMELVTFVGQALGVPVDPVEVTPENFDSVDQLAAYVRRKLELVPGGNCAGS